MHWVSYAQFREIVLGHNFPSGNWHTGEVEKMGLQSDGYGDRRSEKAVDGWHKAFSVVHRV